MMSLLKLLILKHGNVYDQNNKFTYKLRMFQLADCKVDAGNDKAELDSETIDLDVYGHGGMGIRLGPNAGENGKSFYSTTVAPHDYGLKMRGVWDYWGRSVGLTLLLSFLALFALVGLVLFVAWSSLKMRQMCGDLCCKRKVQKNKTDDASEVKPLKNEETNVEKNRVTNVAEEEKVVNAENCDETKIDKMV